MDDPQVAQACTDCGNTPADTHLGEVGPLCDLCFDARISAATGMPRLPEAPAPVRVTGADEREHVMRYRVRRAPTGVTVELRDDGAPACEGYEFGVLGDHDADVTALAAEVRRHAEVEMGRRYLEPGLTGVGWGLAGDEVAGRLEWDPDGSPVRVVVDGRVLTWEEFGQALASLEGWRFRLLIEAPIVDLRPGTAPVEPPASERGGRRLIGDADGAGGQRSRSAMPRHETHATLTPRSVSQAPAPK
jgi:hypothetical protein